MKSLSVLAGFALGFVAFVVIFFLVVRNGIIVNRLRQALVEQNNRLEIEDGKHVIVITRETKAASELSIDCDAIRLTNLSGETDLPFLPPNQEAIIKFTVKNEGGSANNVRVYCRSNRGLELTHTQDPITKLGRYGSQSYKIKVMARNMKAQKITLEFYPAEGPVRALKNKGPVCPFELRVAR